MNLLYRSLRLLGVVLTKILFRLKVTGREEIPRTGAFILVSNHVSYLDPVVLGVASFRELHFMAKETLFRNPLFGMLIRSLNAFPLRREEQDPASLREALHQLHRGKVLVVFPEGGRSRTGDLGPARPGIGLLASHSGVAVVPVYLSGTDRALPRSGCFIRPVPVSVHFGKALFFEGDSDKGHRREAYQAFADKLMDRLREIKSLTK